MKDGPRQRMRQQSGMILWIGMEQETPVLVRIVVFGFLKADYEDQARATRVL